LTATDIEIIFEFQVKMSTLYSQEGMAIAVCIEGKRV